MEHDILKKREVLSLTLRRDKLHESLIQRRLDQIDESKYSIKEEYLYIDSEFKSMFYNSSNQLDLLIEMIQDPDINNKKFALLQMRKLVQTLKNPSQIETLIKPIVFEILVSLLLTTDDLCIIFESSWVLLNLMISSKFVTLCGDYLKPLYELFVTVQEFQLKCHLLNILGNTIDESIDAYRFLRDLGIVKYVCEFNNKNVQLHLCFREIIFWCIGLFLKQRDESVVELALPTMPMIVKYIEKCDNPNAQSEAIFAFYRFSHFYNDDDVCEFVNGCNIEESLVSLISIDSSIIDLKRVLETVINISWMDSDSFKKFYDHGIYFKLETLLIDIIKKNELKTNYFIRQKDLIKDILILINNLVGPNSVTKLRDKIIRCTKIPNLIFEILKYISDKELTEECLRIFLNAMETIDTKIKTELLRIKIPEIFCSYLNFPDPSVQKICLEGVVHCLDYGGEILKGQNIVFVQIKTLLSSELDKLQYSIEEGIIELSQGIINKYFDNNHYN